MTGTQSIMLLSFVVVSGRRNVMCWWQLADHIRVWSPYSPQITCKV